MKVTLLGTGTSQGIPVIACECVVCSSSDPRDKRLRSSILVENNDKRLVVDTGPDFRQQMLREGVSSLHGVLFTHQHKDHTAGMDDIRSFNFKMGCDMPIFARESVLNQLKQEFSYVFAEHKYPGVPRVKTYPIPFDPFSLIGLDITPIEVMHHKLPVVAFRFNDLTYITDANYISEIELAKVRGSKVLIINALEHSAHISHFSLEQALEIIDSIKPEKAYLTHLSHRMGLYSEVSKKLPKNVYLGVDGLQIEL